MPKGQKDVEMVDFASHEKKCAKNACALRRNYTDEFNRQADSRGSYVIPLEQVREDRRHFDNCGSHIWNHDYDDTCPHTLEEREKAEEKLHRKQSTSDDDETTQTGGTRRYRRRKRKSRRKRKTRRKRKSHRRRKRKSHRRRKRKSRRKF